MSVTLRPARPDDGAFLRALYAATRADELAAWGWDAARRDAFLAMQFQAQRRHYEAAWPHAEHRIVCLAGRPIGRLLVAREPGEIRLVDIALLPECRGAGIGAGLIGGLLDEGARAGLPVRLHVARENRARRLYERLGFVVVSGDHEPYLLMERPAPLSSASPEYADT
ncbi:MAG TPA: GNAT family N-acetyltransferase [Thermomicrobiales bacterium]|nr:GNAT family N-acetyltransferase [Thermomicrobiales bacterium]